MKFSTKDFFSKCDQNRGILEIWSHLLKKSLVENVIFCAVQPANNSPFNCHEPMAPTVEEKNKVVSSFVDFTVSKVKSSFIENPLSIISRSRPEARGTEISSLLGFYFINPW